MAETDEDLFFGLGYAMAQDRLWQLDYLRRRATGRLAETLGAAAIESDVVARTAGLAQIAAQELEHLPDATRSLLEAFSAGVNAWIDRAGSRVGIEFDLLGYRPEPWRPVDSLAILGEFRWYLTVRFPVIVMPELARRTLGDGPLFEAFLTAEQGDESILPAGSYPSSPVGEEPVGESVNDPREGEGSNNWVVAPNRTAHGAPLLASDPHIAFGAVSCWYEAHLLGGSFNVAGMAYAGVPGILFGRNPQVAWGITNNICSQRDLYQEQVDDDHPGCFLYDGQWEPERQRTETIQVKGAAPVVKTIRFSRNGPIVDEILPPVARDTGPVSLKWLGATACDELTAILAAGQATNCQEFRDALATWRVPTFSVVFADTQGDIGYQAVGRIPVRRGWRRGYRRGWDPQDQWTGLVPYPGMPSVDNPPAGWICTANNRTAPEDYPYPLSGCWGPGYRARRIRQMLEGALDLSRSDCGEMQQDVLSLRAAEATPKLLNILKTSHDLQIREAVAILGAWDYRLTRDSLAATLFEGFFLRWCETVAAARFKAEETPLVASSVWGLAVRLLADDDVGWFENGDRDAQVILAFESALADLRQRLGAEMRLWRWGRLHRLRLRHPLSALGDLGELLDRHDVPVAGGSVTVCNTSFDADFQVTIGANYRLLADLAEGGLWACDAAGQSGHPGSPHYADQLATWLSSGYHFLPLDRNDALQQAETRMTLTPASAEA